MIKYVYLGLGTNPDCCSDVQLQVVSSDSNYEHRCAWCGWLTELISKEEIEIT